MKDCVDPIFEVIKNWLKEIRDETELPIDRNENHEIKCVEVLYLDFYYGGPLDVGTTFHYSRFTTFGSPMIFFIFFLITYKFKCWANL